MLEAPLTSPVTDQVAEMDVRNQRSKFLAPHNKALQSDLVPATRAPRR